MAYIKVAVFSNVDSLLTYSAETAGAEKTGCRVTVPLGKKTATGVVIETVKAPDIPPDKIKPVKSFIDEEPALNRGLINLGLWMADYYICAPGLVFGAMLAALSRVTSKKIIRLVNEEAELKGKQADVAEYLKDKDGCEATLGELEKALRTRALYTVLLSMEKKGLIEVEEKESNKGVKKKKEKPFTGGGAGAGKIDLNPGQQSAADKITKAIDEAKYKAFLLFGATGSGKTEVYIRASLHAAAAGKKSIILVPEIFLTPQITARFKEVFGDKVAVYHSGLKAAERFGEWERIRSGEVDVVVGTRSAVFAPFESPGLIVVDEEFDTSYKQDKDPRYNARDTAVYRASACGAVVVLGSATPSAETYFNALSGKYEMLKLDGRVLSRPMPVIQVVDLKTDANRNKDLFFSMDLIKEMSTAIEAGGQAILFINRRGFSSYNYCVNCGYVEKCRNCDIPLVYHKAGNVIKCHYCDFQKTPELLCPSCKKPLFYKGAGTQRVEDVIEKFFPGKRIKRVDIDSMREKKEYFKVYRQIKDREIDILVGTQMIAKGFDFPEVTFVGVVAIDTLLNLPDFRAEERVFQLLMQVAGRTGRGDKPGRVLIQTFTPDNPAIRYVKEYKTEEFYDREIKTREEALYPPFGRLLQVIVQDESQGKAFKDADTVAGIIEQTIRHKDIKTVVVLGPSEAPLSRIRNKFRVSILLKSRQARDLNIIGKAIKKEGRGIDATVIVDPAGTL